MQLRAYLNPERTETVLLPAPPDSEERRAVRDERIGGPALHRCFICGSERLLCGHREPELLGWYRSRG